MTLAMNLRVIRVLAFKALNEILRVPGGAIPGILAPAIFLIGINGVFGQAATLFGGDIDFTNWIIGVSLLQAAGFSGAATGVNLARDIEQGWFDRLLLGPAPRSVLLLGIVGSASLRSLFPSTFVLLIGFAIGIDWPGLDGLVLAYVLVMGFAAAAACWGTIMALRFKTQQAAPLMQVVVFASILFSTAYAPEDLLAGWLQTVAELNPTRYILEGARQGFVFEVQWTETWHALLALAGLILVLGGLALRGMRRLGR
ncbi:MAG: ABC transporter permease [Actinomycetota bacterium]|nr:ABC transporter permease [Actinomycetota bacterium]MDQ5807257.1 ABC transporter permease [Actinomycetota bacterium]